MKKRDALNEVFKEANEATFKRMNRMDEIYNYLLRNDLFPTREIKKAGKKNVMK